ncbi:unnamed protein product, partial [Timema podura]|nr:unnamed protein product [Timema podura]
MFSCVFVGSFATASCMQCKYKVTADDIRADIFAQRIPICSRCSGGALPSFNSSGFDYKQESQKGSIPADIPQVLINREPLPHFNFDVELLGDSDVIINQMCH